MSSALRRAVNAARCQSRAEPSRASERASATGGTAKQEFERYIDAELSQFVCVCLHRCVPT